MWFLWFVWANRAYSTLAKLKAGSVKKEHRKTNDVQNSFWWLKTRWWGEPTIKKTNSAQPCKWRSESSSNKRHKKMGTSGEKGSKASGEKIEIWCEAIVALRSDKLNNLICPKVQMAKGWEKTFFSRNVCMYRNMGETMGG